MLNNSFKTISSVSVSNRVPDLNRISVKNRANKNALFCRIKVPSRIDLSDKEFFSDKEFLSYKENFFR